MGKGSQKASESGSPALPADRPQPWDLLCEDELISPPLWDPITLPIVRGRAFHHLLLGGAETNPVFQCVVSKLNTVTWFVCCCFLVVKWSFLKYFPFQFLTSWALYHITLVMSSMMSLRLRSMTRQPWGCVIPGYLFNSSREFYQAVLTVSSKVVFLLSLHFFAFFCLWLVPWRLWGSRYKQKLLAQGLYVLNEWIVPLWSLDTVVQTRISHKMNLKPVEGSKNTEWIICEMWVDCEKNPFKYGSWSCEDTFTLNHRSPTSHKHTIHDLSARRRLRTPPFYEKEEWAHISVMPLMGEQPRAATVVKGLGDPDHWGSESGSKRPRAPGAFWSQQERKSCWWQKGAGE